MSTLLVSGASGQLGRRVVELLLESGDHTVIAASRDPARLADLAARGAIVRALDFDAPDPRAFAGVDRALLISVDALEGRLERHRRAIDAAVQAGVGHLVYTSIVSPRSPHLLVGPDHAGSEASIQAGARGYTLLRNDLYADLLLGAIAPAVATGQLITARGDGRIAYVTREDCARAAAAALRDGFDGQRVVDVTGPESLSGEDLAGILTALTGREVVHTSVPVEGFVEGLVAHAGLPRPIADLLASFERAAAAGDLAAVSPGVRALTGADPTRVRDLLAAHLAAQPG